MECKKNITVNAVLIDKHCYSSVLMLCAPTIWNSLPSFVRAADRFTSFRFLVSARLTCSQAGPLSTPLIPLLGLSHVTNLLLTAFCTNTDMCGIQEELAILRKKLDRAKKIEMASSADEVLMEEIREYKEQLTCPSCKVKKKDAVLTKCFHVFCLECLRTRYETRQRKCPKCNATFGANDYHRIYLE